MGQTPDIAEVIDDAIQNGLRSIYTCLPGVIVNYYPQTQYADVSPLVTLGEEDQRGILRFPKPPVIKNVPVIFPGSGYGSKSFSFTLPLDEGDDVLLVFANAPIGEYKAHGGDVNAQGRGRLSDCVAIPGLRDRAHKRTETISEAMVLTVPKNKELRLGDDGATKIGADDKYAVVIELSLQDFMTALAAAITASSGSPQGAAFGTALQTALLALNFGLGWKARSLKVKAK